MVTINTESHFNTLFTIKDKKVVDRFFKKKLFNRRYLKSPRHWYYSGLRVSGIIF